MRTKILSRLVVAISAVLLAGSLAAILAIWIVNQPLTDDALARLETLDGELAQAEATLDVAEGELRRALRILDGAERALEALSQQSTLAQKTLSGIGEALDDRVIPGLRGASEQIGGVRSALQGVLAALQAINATALLGAPIPGEELLTRLLQATDALDAQILSVEQLARQASTFLADVEYLLGGDLEETRQGLEGLVTVISEYRLRIAEWRSQIGEIRSNLASGVDLATVFLTAALLWFAFSQAGLIVHGLALEHGHHPLEALRRPPDLDAPPDPS